MTASRNLIAIFIAACFAHSATAQSNDTACTAENPCFVFEDDAGTNSPPGSALDLTGANDVSIHCMDTSDAEITSLTVDSAGHTGTMTNTSGC